MLQEFRVDNFKSLINIVFKPQGVNLLLGENNSGKTSLCQALRFVSRSSVLPLDACVDEVVVGRSRLVNFTLDKATTEFYVRAELLNEEASGRSEKLTFEYELTISSPKAMSADATVRLERERLRVTGGEPRDSVLLENIAGCARLLHEKDSMNGESRYVETAAPTDATMLQRLYDREANPRANRFKDYMVNWTYYDLSPDAMRGSAHKPREAQVTPDGGNLASVLYWLKTSNEREYRELLKVVREVDPDIDLINFFSGAENSIFMFFEDQDGHELSSIGVSSGTLRFLALAYVLLVQSRGGLSPLCIIEEPENGIYVGFLKTLFEMVDPAPGRPQLIFTSHAPYFIDLFDDRLGGIFVLPRRGGHASMVQPDPAKVKARLEEFPLGERHFREMLM